MLKAKNVTERTDINGDSKGYVNTDGTGTVKAIIDEFEITTSNRAEVKSDGVIIASLLPQAHLLNINTSTNFSGNITLYIGTKDGSANLKEPINYSNNNNANVKLRAKVSTKTLGEMTNTTSAGVYTEGKAKVNSEGLVDIIMRSSSDITETGTMTVVIQYI